MLKSILFTFLIFLSQWGFTQNQSIDSLIQRIGSEKIDSNKYNLCIEIAKAYSYSAYDKSLIYFNKALEISDKFSDRKKLAHIYHQIGYMYQRKGEFPLALKNYNDALTIHEYIKNKKGIGQILNDIGLIYKTWGKYDKALEYYINALRLFDETGDVVNGAMTSNNVGQIYYYRSEYEKAIEFFTKYLEANKKANSPRAVAGAANNIASAYMEIGKLDDALSYYQTSMKIYDSLNINIGVAIIKDNIGSLFLRKKQYDEALSYHLDALKIFEEIKSQARICSSLQSIGIAYLKLKKIDTAIKYLNRSLDIALKLDQKETQKDVYESLSEAYQAKNQFEKALVYLKNYIQIKDTLLNAETINKIETIQAEYDAQRKEKEMAEINQKLESQKMILPLSIGLIILFLFFLLLILRENSQKKKALIKNNRQQEILFENLIKTGKMFTSLANEKLNIQSHFTNYRLIRSISNSIECCSFVANQRNSSIFFAFLSNRNQAIGTEIITLSILDFFESQIEITEHSSILNQYKKFISKDSRWSKIIGNENSIEVDFWMFDKSLNQYIYSGVGYAYFLRNGSLSKIIPSSTPILVTSHDQFYFISLFFGEIAYTGEKDEIVSSIEKTIQGSLNQSFEGRNDILASNLDFLKTRFDGIIEISISAFEV